MLLQLRPNFADAWSNLASAYMRKGRLNEATQCCRQALALNHRLVVHFCTKVITSADLSGGPFQYTLLDFAFLAG